MKKHNSIKFSRCVPLPIGYKLAVCPICGGIHLTGTLLMKVQMSKIQI